MNSFKSLQFRQVLTQAVKLCMIVTSALIIWKALMCFTGTESPVTVVLSGSMEPALRRGDMLFLHMSKEPIREGEIVVFNVDGNEIPIVHRVIEVREREGTGEVDILTKGDNNPGDDRLLYAPGQLWLQRRHIIGRVVGFLPYAGWGTIIVSAATTSTLLDMISGLNTLLLHKSMEAKDEIERLRKENCSKTRSTRPSTRRVLGTRLVTVAILAYSVPLVGQQKIGRVLGPTRSNSVNSVQLGQLGQPKKKGQTTSFCLESLITRLVAQSVTHLSQSVAHLAPDLQSLSLTASPRRLALPALFSRPVRHLSPSPPSSLFQSASSRPPRPLLSPNPPPLASSARPPRPLLSPSPPPLALPALFSRPVRLLSPSSLFLTFWVGEESGVDGGLEPRRGPRIQEIRELDEHDFISDDEEEIDDLSFDFESDSEGVQDGYGEEEFEA
ncbi:hypothetical protein ACLB2K_070386 [Fragaria x ananassa]